MAKVSDGHPHRTRLYDAHEDAYMTPYAEQDVAYILSLGYESIEHIVPRSYYAGESAAQNDPFGWVVAASYKNSLRKNLPLMLWTSEGVGDNMYAELIISDERHFVRGWSVFVPRFLRDQGTQNVSAFGPFCSGPSMGNS